MIGVKQEHSMQRITFVTFGLLRLLASAQAGEGESSKADICRKEAETPSPPGRLMNTFETDGRSYEVREARSPTVDEGRFRQSMTR